MPNNALLSKRGLVWETFVPDGDEETKNKLLSWNQLVPSFTTTHGPQREQSGKRGKLPR